MIITIGDNSFEGLKTPRTWNETDAVRFARIPHIDGKDSLQFVGGELKELELSFRFVHEFCDPLAEVQKFIDAMETATVLPVTGGDGTVIGKFVIEEMERGIEQVAPSGEIESVVLSVKFIEYIAPPGINKKGLALTSKSPVPALPRSAKMSPANAITQSLATARNAVTSANASMKGYKDRIKSAKRTMREVKRSADTAKRAYSDAKSKVLRTQKILSRAGDLPHSLDEGMEYADNILALASMADMSDLERDLGKLTAQSEVITTAGTPVSSFASTREGGQ